MWQASFFISIFCLLFSALFSIVINKSEVSKKFRPSLFRSLFAGVFFAVLLIFIPVHSIAAESVKLGNCGVILLSVFRAMQVFTIGCEFSAIEECMKVCPDWLDAWYLAWAATLYVLAPIFTFGFVLSLFKNLSAHLQYFVSFFKETYVFSELNANALVLAKDIKKHHKNAAIVFTDVLENDETADEFFDAARKFGAICFTKNILSINFKVHSRRKKISFFAIGKNETENLNQALALIEAYESRENTHIYIFSTKIESELLIASANKGNVKVRRINEVQSLVNRLLYEQGNILFDSARERSGKEKLISAVVVGMGGLGTEMVKALSWYGQMDGYQLEINAFDKDPLTLDKFVAIAPELMSDTYNGAEIPGEAQYKITIHSGIDVSTISFANAIGSITDATYVIVSLGNDDVNIDAAVKLRMYFERMKIHPVIQAVVRNSQKKEALDGVKNYRGQSYDIGFVGDIESLYAENVIIDSKLEDEALARHLKWGTEEEFWNYEYNYRSSVASAIHMTARIHCGISGADKKEDELTLAERDIIESLEHRRWNAYMRAEGYVYSGSNDRASRNDLAKMHHDLVDYSSLSDEEKRKDSSVGTK